MATQEEASAARCIIGDDLVGQEITSVNNSVNVVSSQNRHHLHKRFTNLTCRSSIDAPTVVGPPPTGRPGAYNVRGRPVGWIENSDRLTTATTNTTRRDSNGHSRRTVFSMNDRMSSKSFEQWICKLAKNNDNEQQTDQTVIDAAVRRCSKQIISSIDVNDGQHSTASCSEFKKSSGRGRTGHLFFPKKIIRKLIHECMM